MKHLLVYLLLSIFMVSCLNSKKPEKPENLLSKDEMVNLIIDISLFSAAKGINKTTLEKNGIYPLDYIYKKHQIDSLQFALSNAYYAHDIMTYESIYNRVNDSLNTLKSIYKKLEEEENIEVKKNDSIKKTKRWDSIRSKKIKLKENTISPSKNVEIRP